MITPKVLYCKRIAIRRYPGSPWQWYSLPVFFTLRGSFEEPRWYTAQMVLESFCANLAKERGMDFLKSGNAKIVEAPSVEALECADMREL